MLHCPNCGAELKIERLSFTLNASCDLCEESVTAATTAGLIRKIERWTEEIKREKEIEANEKR